MSRRNRKENADPFSNLQDAPTLEQTDSEIFGTIQPGKHLRAKPISIFSIYPDLSQPRRAIPSDVRQGWIPVPEEMQVFLQHWVDDCGFDLGDLLAANSEFDRPEYTQPSQRALMSLIDLAASILHSGLVNPITVLQQGDIYKIETGERRWIAYHLLYLHTQDQQWAQIHARIVKSIDLWRQAAENGARDDLNAVGKARQLAILLMDLHPSSRFKPIEDFKHEQDFYAQVADGNQYPIPRGRSEMLLSVMGLKHADQLRQYRGILRVPHDFWDYADDQNLTEGEIRKAAKNDYSVTPVTPKRPAPPSEIDTLEDLLIKSRHKYQSMAKRLKKASSHNKQRAADLINEQIEELVQLRNSLDS